MACCAAGEIRKRIKIGSTANKTSSKEVKNSLENDMFRKNNQIKKGNISGKNATKPFVRNPKLMNNPEGNTNQNRWFC
jgi:hypothetical protein